MLFLVSYSNCSTGIPEIAIMNTDYWYHGYGKDASTQYRKFLPLLFFTIPKSLFIRKNVNPRRSNTFWLPRPHVCGLLQHCMRTPACPKENPSPTHTLFPYRIVWRPIPALEMASARSSYSTRRQGYPRWRRKRLAMRYVISPTIVRGGFGLILIFCAVVEAPVQGKRKQVPYSGGSESYCGLRWITISVVEK